MENKTYGYIRVSSKDQNEERQLISLHTRGVEDGRIYIDKRSGKDFDRPQYRKLVRKLRPGDLLVVQSIDRMGRNYEEVQNQWRLLTREKNVDICVIDMPLLDTRKSRDLTGTLISDIVLQLLSYVAQLEREFIHQRQAEGIAAAKAQGVRFGREPLPVPAEFPEVLDCWKHGKIGSRRAGALLGVSQTTFLKWCKEWE